MIRLHGITWDHIRGVAPLLATSIEFQRQNPNVEIVWDKRTLEEFESYPLEILTEKYDFIMLDHPFMGTGVQKRVILPLNEIIPGDYLQDQKINSVGPSFDTYTWEGKQWALAVDSAAQVSAYRPDLLRSNGAHLPRSWEDVIDFAHSLPPDIKIGMPLSPTHAFCSFLTLCANIGDCDFWNEAEGIEPSIGVEALDTLQKLLPLVHPVSLDSNPIKILDLMANSNEIMYVPLTFGYSTYSQLGFGKHIIHFADIPTFGNEPSGSVIGGVGLAISARCKNIPTAVEYAMYVASGECQKGIYAQNGGQPGHRMAWTSQEVNRDANGFYENTLRTLDLSYIRPRHKWYIPFQEQGGERIRQFLLHEENVNDVMKSLNKLYRELKCKNGIT